MRTRELLKLRNTGHPGINALFAKAHSADWDFENDVDEARVPRDVLRAVRMARVHGLRIALVEADNGDDDPRILGGERRRRGMVQRAAVDDRMDDGPGVREDRIQP